MARAEFDRASALMEQLDRREAAGSPLSPEENALRALLEQLVRTYDEKIELPRVSPLEMLQIPQCCFRGFQREA